MDDLLCDELLLQVFQRLPSISDANSASLVSKRWLYIRRSSATTLSLLLPVPANGCSLSSLLSHYPNLSTLTVIADSPDSNHSLSNCALLSLSSVCGNLTSLRFLVGPVTASSLQRLSSCKSLSSLKIMAFRSLDFRWLAGFQALRELSVTFLDCSEDGSSSNSAFDCSGDSELQLKTVCFTGIGNGDVGIDWIWRNCRKITKLQFSSCEGIGNTVSDSSFLNVLAGIREIGLITCRSIIRNLLFLVAEHCRSLVSLVLYDGGDREALIEVIRHCKLLKKIDLRLPLDLDDDGLVVIGQNSRELRSLCLRSCELISGESLRSLARVLSSSLEELVLVNCDAVEREPGLLTVLGQCFRSLRKLDLSYNESLLDREVGSVLDSCRNLSEIRLRGCKGLTDMTVCSIIKNCHVLQVVDINQCHKITGEGAGLLLQIPTLSQILVEQRKIPHVDPKSSILQQTGASCGGHPAIWSPTDSATAYLIQGTRRPATPIIWTDR